MRRASAAVVALVACGPAMAADALGEKPQVGSAIAVLDAWIESTRVARDEPGLSIAIVHDQDVIWARSYGVADLRTRQAKLRHGCRAAA